MNILLADDNLMFTKSLANYLGEREEKIRITNISTNGKEVLEQIEKGNIDVILLDLEMPILNGEEFLEELKKKQLEKIPKIIIISGYVERFYELSQNPLVSTCISKTESIENIYEKIKEMIADCEEDNIKKKIRDQLGQVTFNVKQCGTQYLEESIYMAYCHPEYASNLEKNIYQNLSKKYKKTKFTIKSDILKAIHYMYLETPEEVMKKFFNITEDKKPSPKWIINTILNNI